MSKIFIISVCNNLSVYNRAIATNPHLGNCLITKYDNSQDNLPIPTRYNHFINHQLNREDGWLIFCHQDFEFLCPPEKILQKLDKNCVYGPIGVALKPHKYWKLLFYPYNRRPSVRIGNESKECRFGEIYEGTEKSHTTGRKISKPKTVDTVDCCCLMIHSSLLRSSGLRFDETFDFHLYTEDFCLAARHKNIPVKAVQCDCCHYSRGTMNQSFWNKYELLQEKYPDDFFLTTCVSHPRQVLFHKLKNKVSDTWLEQFAKEFLP